MSHYRAAKLYSIVLSVTLGSFVWGYSLTVFNALHLFIKQDLFPDASEQAISFLGSAVLIGAAVGSFYTGTLASKIGRLKTLLITDVIGILGSSLCLVKNLAGNPCWKSDCRYCYWSK